MSRLDRAASLINNPLDRVSSWNGYLAVEFHTHPTTIGWPVIRLRWQHTEWIVERSQAAPIVNFESTLEAYARAADFMRKWKQ